MSARSFYDPLGLGGVTLLSNASPIVGDPEPVVQLAAGQYLTTGDLDKTDAGEAGGLAAMAIEMWFDTSTSTPSGGDFIAYGPVTDSTNRQWELDLGSTGLVTFKVRSASLSSISATAINPLQRDTWYHLVGVLEQGVAIRLYINGVQAASGSWNDSIRESDLYPGDTGFVAGSNDMRLGDAGGAGIYTYAAVAFYRSSLSATRVAAHYTAGHDRGFGQHLTSTRVGAILDAADSNAPRSIRASTRSITPRYMVGQAIKDALAEAVAAESVDAVLFCSASGALTFLQDGHRSTSPYDTVQTVFDDDGTDTSYLELELDYSDSFLANEVTVTREGTSEDPGQTQTASDQASIDRYFKRPLSLTGLPVVDDATALSIATAMLAKYKLAMQRIVGLSFNTIDPDTTMQLLRRELCDRIRVLRTAPGGGARIDQTLFIQKIEIDADSSGPWAIRLGVSPL